MHIPGIIPRKGRTEYPPEGGVLWWPTPEHPYPLHGKTTEEELFVAEMVKKYVMGWLHVFTAPPWRWFAMWVNQFERYAQVITDQYVDVQLLSPAVKALYDALIQMFPMRHYAVRAVCFVLEKDKHYRWIMQDLIMEAKSGSLTKKPRREILRLVNVFFTRENRPRIKALKWPARILVFLIPSLGYYARRFVMSVRLVRFQMDKFDLWAACSEANQPEMSYRYGGLSQEKMLELYQRL